MTWEQKANCRSDGVDPDWFFARPSEPEAQLAKAVCAWCVVRDKCLEMSRGVRFGTWGGQDEKERL